MCGFRRYVTDAAAVEAASSTMKRTLVHWHWLRRPPPS